MGDERPAGRPVQQLAGKDGPLPAHQFVKSDRHLTQVGASRVSRRDWRQASEILPRGSVAPVRLLVDVSSPARIDGISTDVTCV